MLRQQFCVYDRAHAKERRVNSQFFKDMTASFMLDFKIGLRVETSLHEQAHASLEMQLKLQRELKIYQAQAMEMNMQLGAYQDRSLATNTHLAQLLTRGPIPDHNDVHSPPSMVSTKVV
jgi:hypothetical protein